MHLKTASDITLPFQHVAVDHLEEREGRIILQEAHRSPHFGVYRHTQILVFKSGA